MNKDWTDKTPQAKFPMLLYDRVCSWLMFAVSFFLTIGALFQLDYTETYPLGAMLLVAALLAFIASILLENRARRS